MGKPLADKYGEISSGIGRGIKRVFRRAGIIVNGKWAYGIRINNTSHEVSGRRRNHHNSVYIYIYNACDYPKWSKAGFL